MKKHKHDYLTDVLKSDDKHFSLSYKLMKYTPDMFLLKLCTNHLAS